MAQEIIMPKTGMAMEEGTIIEWFIKPGDKVSKGDILAELETDKSTMEYESDYEGTVLEILYPAGSTVKVTLPIAWLGEPGEKIPHTDTHPVETRGEEPQKESISVPKIEEDVVDGKTKATPAARRVARERNLDISHIPPSGSHNEVKEIDVVTFEATKVKATPLASRMAHDKKIQLDHVKGSGYQGKIYSTDLPKEHQPTFIGNEVRESTTIRLNKVKKITGERMVYSHTTIPMVTEHAKADVTDLLKIRKQINETTNLHISINDLIMLATSKLLPSFPIMNSSIDKDIVTLHGNVHLGMAIASEKGLLVAVIKDADRMSLSQLSKHASLLVEKGRKGELKSDELQGSTFTITNVGKWGILSFNPIINSPEAAILGVCAIEDVPAIQMGELVVVKKIGLSLTFDHRIIDGSEAAEFMQALIHSLEHPYSFLV